MPQRKKRRKKMKNQQSSDVLKILNEYQHTKAIAFKLAVKRNKTPKDFEKLERLHNKMDKLADRLDPQVLVSIQGE